jgi:hypothetical protein
VDITEREGFGGWGRGRVGRGEGERKRRV